MRDTTVSQSAGAHACWLAWCDSGPRAALPLLDTRHDVTHLMCIGLDGNGEVASEAQVRHLEQRVRGVVVHQQVLRLQVAMHHSMLVHVRHTLEQLVHEALHGWVGWVAWVGVGWGGGGEGGDVCPG